MAKPRFELDPNKESRSRLLFDCGQPHSMGVLHRLPTGPNGWTIEQEDPLTVSPSIHDTACGTHGWIRNGQWVPA